MKEHNKMKEAALKDEVRALRKQIEDLEISIEKEKLSKKKIENIKNNDRKNFNQMEADKGHLESELEDLSRNCNATILALENEIIQRKKVEEGYSLQAQRVASLESQNKELLE